MKAEIDEEGVLLIERAGRIGHVHCPFDESKSACHDGCRAWKEIEDTKGILIYGDCAAMPGNALVAITKDRRKGK